jgi:hypothetical protein
VRATRVYTAIPTRQHTGRRFQSESTLQEIEIRAICPDLDL